MYKRVNVVRLKINKIKKLKSKYDNDMSNDKVP